MSENESNSPSHPTNPTTWVKFEDESNKGKEPTELNEFKESVESNESPAVLTTESVHVNPDRNNVVLNSANVKSSVPNAPQTSIQQKPLVVNTNNVSASVHLNKNSNNATNNNSQTVTVDPTPALRNVELNTEVIRQGFVNGDPIVTLLPVNSRWPWITSAQFRPELVPEELMAQGLTLTVEEYVQAMELLVNDFRFTMYNICYKRILVCWILLAFFVLIGLLFSGLSGLPLFALGVTWLLLNAAAIFFCMWVKMRLSRGLERCLARVNKLLMRHKLIVALDDKGRISCHKVNLCFMYLDAGPCISHLQGVIEREEQAGNGPGVGWEGRLDVRASDIVIQGSTTTRLSRKQERATLLYLRYASRWSRQAIRGLVDVSPTSSARHCVSYRCPCQFIEEHLQCKPRGKWNLRRLCWVPDQK